MIYHCCDDRRRLAVLQRPGLNGLDFVEVLDSEAPLGSPRQHTLLLSFVKPAPALLATQFEISGGDRIPSVGVVWATPASAPDAALVSPAEAALLAALPAPERVIALRTDSSGDHATYTLQLVAEANALAPPAGIDPLLARVRFAFKVECPADVDCAQSLPCPPEAAARQPLSYLAKDYRSFRRLMLDRLAQTLPDWTERNAADLGVTLVELLAYVGDHLSYAQDAVATEAYIGTARRRASVRRHARLVDYAMHDGANARTWVQVQIDGPSFTLEAADTKFLTRVAGAGLVVPPPAADPLFDRLLAQHPVVFEPMHDQVLHAELNELFFHDWGNGECCLPAGSVRATLRGSWPMLQPGQVLVFEERLGPRTGRASDADPGHRWAVRLVQVAAGLQDPATDPAEPITEIRWAADDTLPFALCLSARTATEYGGAVVRDVSVALGNIVLADHGRSIAALDLGTVPEPHLHSVPARRGDGCTQPDRLAVPPRYRPRLPEAPVTQAAPYADPLTPASTALARPPSQALPRIALTGVSDTGNADWRPRRDLLSSGEGERHFVVEIEVEGRAELRFGDGRHGQRPASGTRFVADLRIGNGSAGNIGADGLAHVVSGQGGIIGVRNPLPAAGGIEPESAAAVRIAAGQAFRVQQRAVTEADYAELAQRHPQVQRAAATFRWNGHGHTVFVSVDRRGGLPVTPDFEDELIAFLEPYRMAGYNLEINDPRFVAIDLGLMVCVRSGHFRAPVRQAVLQVLGDQRLADGRLGLFHPDQWSFDDDVWLSRIVAAVQAVPGVESVTVKRFGRLDAPDPRPLATGVLPIGRLEIARLANDPDHPERGHLELALGGGQ
jgi:Baseplate J-like protein